MLLLVGRLVQIQILNGSNYSKISVEQVRTSIATPALRGSVYDRFGQILAVSQPTSLVIADDFQIKHPVAEAAALAPLVGESAQQLLPKLQKKSGYVILTNSLNITDGHKLAARYFPGIVVLNSSERKQPNGAVGTALLGGVNSSGSGSAGLEYQYQSLLAGKSGLERVFASPSGISLPGSRTVVVRPAKAGQGLELTIDTPLQFVTEQALAQELVTTKAVSGVAIIMDVKTGQIFANASLVNTNVSSGQLGPIPSWGKSVGVKGVQQTINDLAFTNTYEPGSVFKVVTFSAALQAGAITPTSTFTVPYSVHVSNRVFHDAEYHPLESLSATQILAQSSNIGTYEIANRVGEENLLAQVQRLGFGQSTDLNFPGETPGLLVNAATWYPSDLAALPIGQVDAVTPIQVIDAYNAIANGGEYVAPKLVLATVSANGTVKKTPPSLKHVAFTPTVASELKQMLQQVVLVGTGTNAIIPGYEVAGKTGTAQIPTPGHSSYIKGAYNASFVGFAPAQNPVLTMLVVIERPQSTIYGGAVAAPVFKRVMSYALHHYGIPSTSVVQKPLKGTSASISSDVT
jgi:cell division protein FtsI (penicillin-binding protein 3)